MLVVFSLLQMYGRYAQELGTYAKEEAARFRAAGVRNQTPDQLEYEKDPCVKCQSESDTCAHQGKPQSQCQPGVWAGLGEDMSCVLIVPHVLGH